MFRAPELQVDQPQRLHGAIFAALVAVVLLILVPAARGSELRVGTSPLTEMRLIHYRAHDGVMRPAWLLLPAGYHGGRIPLVISPHGRGVDDNENALLWGDLPGAGDFAVINPAGEGRRLHWYSWGDPAQIADLARMPSIVAHHGVRVNRRRIYAFGGSMGGQEVLLLLARYPHLLAGVAAFDPATDMARRYRDFASLKHGRMLQRLARREIGGTPAQVPRAYALRSPDHYARRIARSEVPVQLFWSSRDTIIRDQRVETNQLADTLADDGDRVWDFHGQWRHTAEMEPGRRLPRALARFDLLPWRDAPAIRARLA